MNKRIGPDKRICRETQSHASKGELSLRPAKVNKVKIFSGPYYMIKRVLTFVSGVQESVLVDFICQNFA